MCPVDTPGLHIFHRVLHLLSPDEMASLHPRKKLRPYIPPSPLSLSQETSEDDPFRDSWGVVGDEPESVSGSYEWGSIARIELLEAPPSTTIVFYGPNILKVSAKSINSGEGKPMWGTRTFRYSNSSWGDLLIIHISYEYFQYQLAVFIVNCVKIVLKIFMQPCVNFWLLFFACLLTTSFLSFVCESRR